MERIVRLVGRFIREEDGLETVEYAIIAGLITVGTILTIAGVAMSISARFSRLEQCLATPTTPGGPAASAVAGTP